MWGSGASLCFIFASHSQPVAGARAASVGGGLVGLMLLVGASPTYLPTYTQARVYELILNGPSSIRTFLSEDFFMVATGQ